MDCRVWSVDSGVSSVECECRVGCGVWSGV